MKLLLMTCWGEEKDWRRCHNLTPEGLLMTSVPGTIPSGRATKAWTFPVIDMTAISYSWATLLGTQGSNSWCTYGHSRSSINCKSHPVCGWSWIYWWLDKETGKIDGNAIFSHQKVHSPPRPENELQTTNRTWWKHTFFGAKNQKLHKGYITLSVFDKIKAWNFPVIRYTHGTSQALVVFNPQQ